MGLIEIPGIGTTVAISSSEGGECNVEFFQYRHDCYTGQDFIKDLGSVDCGDDMLKEFNYSYVESDSQKSFAIMAESFGNKVGKVVASADQFYRIETVGIFDYGYFVSAAQSAGEFYGIEFYRVTEDAQELEIIKAGYLDASR